MCHIAHTKVHVVNIYTQLREETHNVNDDMQVRTISVNLDITIDFCFRLDKNLLQKIRELGACAHGRRQGVQGGALAPPWNLEMMKSYAVFKQNTLKFFARASGARIK